VSLDLRRVGKWLQRGMGASAQGQSAVHSLAHERTVHVVLLFLIAGLAVVPLFSTAYILQFATDLLTFTALTYSWNLISGCTGYLSFGQVSFFGIGAYATAALVLHSSIPWYFAAPIGSVLAGAIAALLGMVMLRLRGIMFALGMLGLARILAVVASNWDFIGGSSGLTLPAQLTPVAVYFVMWGAVLMAFGFNAFLLRSGWGLAAMGVRDDEAAASAIGVPTARVKITVFILSALAPAVVGGLVAWNRSFLDPPSAFDPTLDLQVVVFALFGGIGTLWGPALGSAVLMALGEEFWAYLPDLQLALYGVLVIAVVLAFPGGIVGIANRYGWLRRKPILAPKTFPIVVRPPRPLEPGSEFVVEVRNLTVRFGGLVALDGVSLAVKRGETVTIIGANGAGKTTLFNTIAGMIKPTAGEVLYQGQAVAAIPPYRRARMGIARTFQIPRLMMSMTVWENALLAARNGKRAHDAVDQAAWALKTVGLDSMWLDPASKLTPGQQRRLELARSLALDPTVVLLDEVMAGMTREEQGEIRSVLRRLKEFGVSAVAGVEHVISAIADLSDRMIVLDHGVKIAEGTPDAVLRDPKVVQSYLGEMK
jgi:branched-chain amino acid transport system permease protein